MSEPTPLQDVLAGESICLAQGQFSALVVNLIHGMIQELGATVSTDKKSSTILLTNPSHQSFRDSPHLFQPNAHSEPKIYPYHWLAWCKDQRRHTTLTDLRPEKPLFIYPARSEDWRPLRAYVSLNLLRNNGEEDGRAARHNCSRDLLLHGALIVSKRADADILVIEKSTEFYKVAKAENKKAGRSWQRFVERSWVNGCLRTGKMGWRRAKHDQKEDSGEESFGDEPLVQRGPGRPVGAARVDYTPDDDDFLCRWLAAHFGSSGSLSSRKTYEMLAADSARYPTAARHPPQSWHERFRKKGHILKERVHRYAREGVDKSLKTKAERRVSKVQEPSDEEDQLDSSDGEVAPEAGPSVVVGKGNGKRLQEDSPARETPVKKKKRQIALSDDEDNTGSPTKSRTPSKIPTPGRSENQATTSQATPSQSAVVPPLRDEAPRAASSSPIRPSQSIPERQPAEELVPASIDDSNSPLVPSSQASDENAATNDGAGQRTGRSSIAAASQADNVPKEPLFFSPDASPAENQAYDRQSRRSPSSSPDIDLPQRSPYTSPGRHTGRAEQREEESIDFVGVEPGIFESFPTAEKVMAAEPSRPAEDETTSPRVAVSRRSRFSEASTAPGDDEDVENLTGLAEQSPTVSSQRLEVTNTIVAQEVRIVETGPSQSVPRQALPSPPTNIRPASELIRTRATRLSPLNPSVNLPTTPRNGPSVDGPGSRSIPKGTDSNIPKASPLPAAIANARKKSRGPRRSLLQEQIAGSAIKRRRTLDRLSGVFTPGSGRKSAGARSGGHETSTEEDGELEMVDAGGSNTYEYVRGPPISTLSTPPGPPAEPPVPPRPRHVPANEAERAEMFQKGQSVMEKVKARYKEKVEALAKRYGVDKQEITVLLTKLGKTGSRGEQYWADVESQLDRIIAKV
ncbi:hypothetical protein L202_05657 [Cryptococcus amylolentus CBS 6039]|uniref:TERF2-interacting telomeric protein 1 Myb domain-containing protein n=2 Tax=Cryptococcus amylolentus TaxID=104669 RepID=A0A1E3HN19_9TREE|nr:hypothetical protein L202_05657 [Cryptococcus amylolentus CBS 6039]ODN77126.1 hypothetical protein L202_05657 [Cryptococcus amylolentus CBS 6039]ODO04974.1 hypothetical protein I350_05585 [Cryptococcus amylolentus CBS 6273]